MKIGIISGGLALIAAIAAGSVWAQEAARSRSGDISGPIEFPFGSCVLQSASGHPETVRCESVEPPEQRSQTQVFDISDPLTCPIGTTRYLHFMELSESAIINYSNPGPSGAVTYWTATARPSDLPPGQIVTARWHLLATTESNSTAVHINFIVLDPPTGYLWMSGVPNAGPMSGLGLTWTQANFPGPTDIHDDLDSPILQRWNSARTQALTSGGNPGIGEFRIDLVGNSGFFFRMHGAAVDVCIRNRVRPAREVPRPRS